MTHWVDRAECQDKDLQLFFEGYECDQETAIEVDELCAHCPVKRECLTMGIQTSGTGVHGGVYLSLGKFSKARNKHKSTEDNQAFKDLISEIKNESH